MSTIRIVFLGTSAAVPQKDRFLSSIALQRENGEVLLFDCGEGTQYQLMKFNVNFQRISRILLTHLHGDHIFGLFGLLNTMNLMGRQAPIKIFGPAGTQEFIEAILGTKKNHGFSFPVEMKEIEEGLVYETKKYRLFAQKVPHSVYSLSFAYIEKPRLGRFNVQKAKELKVKRGPKWNQLQEGEPVLSEENKVVLPEMVLGKKRRGFKLIFGSDGLYPPETFVPFAHQADVLILEATFGDEEEEHAYEKLHSTARLSARIAKQANVKRLYLTHISPRYNDPTVLEKQAREEFPETIIAYDGLEINLNRSDLEKEERERAKEKPEKKTRNKKRKK
ncbi:MAG: ribonuclease Z [Candidatus Heimdallarchaeota archaeon]|nr:ribonuclease Z [Candidatus Heimdallarchaeota archaeon]